MGFVLTAVGHRKKRGSARCWRPPYLLPSWRSDAAVPLPELSTARLPLWSEIVRGFPELCPGYFSCFFRVFWRFASSVRSTRLSPGYRRSGLPCRGRFSFAARCRCPKDPTPRGVAAFRSVRHVDEEFEPAFGFDLRHGYRTTVRCLGLVCGLFIPESDALQFVGRKGGYGLSRGALLGAQQYLVIMRRYGAWVTAVVGRRTLCPIEITSRYHIELHGAHPSADSGFRCPTHRC